MHDNRRNAYERANEDADKAVAGLREKLFQEAHKPESFRQLFCPRCSKLLFDVEQPTFLVALCDCLKQIQETTFQAALVAYRPEDVEHRWDQCNIPRRFRSESFATFKRRPGAEQALAACRSYADEFKPGATTTGLFLVGPYGSGKSHLAVAVARALVEKHLLLVHFTTPIKLLNNLKADWDWSAVEDATRAPLLIIDDLGQDIPSTFDRGAMFNLINERSEEMRPTIITSNNGDQQLNGIVGGALVSRLYQMCELVILEASDFRKGQAS